MRLELLAVALLLGVPAIATAQEPETIRAGQSYDRTLAGGDKHVYTLPLEADRFVYGTANQRTVDVIVTVLGPDGERLGVFDAPARGPEPFQFTSRVAGPHRIEVRPFKADTGQYTLTVARVEPKATTPEGTVDQLMAAYDGPDTPGGVVAVVRDGELRFAKGYGMADLEHGIGNAPELRYNVGSVAKQFTAFAIALLADRGELSLDDDIRTYVPEVPDFGDTIRIRHLLNHTSGLREYLNLLLIGGRDLEGGDVIRHDEVLRLVARQPELQSAPGSTFLYNNTGYLLLAEIVERVSGRPFAAWMEDNVFRPLGMNETVIVTEVGQLVPRRAGGHTPTEAGSFRRAEDLSGSWGPGSLHTTVGDLAKWVDNFGEPRVGGPRVIEMMTTRAVLTTGDTVDYALGVFVDRQRGLARIQHGGNDMGHAAQVAYYPTLDAGVIVLSNLAGGHARRVADQVAEAYFGEHMEPGPASPEKAASPEADAAEDGVVAVSRETLERYAGEYQIEGGPPVSFTLEEDGFYTQITGQPRFALRALSDSAFQVLVPGVDARVVFHAGEAGPVERATLHQAGREMTVSRIAPWSPTAAELAAYAGRYFSPELEASYTLAVVDDALVATHVRLGDIPLEPTERDSFRSDELALHEVDFERDAAGRITAFAVSNGRTVGVRFERQE